MIRVMIIASYIEVREGLCTVLRLAGDIEITSTAASLNSAINQASKGCPDVVLVDLEMPDCEGYETIRQLKRRHPATKSIALTAHDYPAARKSAIQAGADIVMVKGLDVPGMLAAIRAAAGVNETDGRSPYE